MKRPLVFLACAVGVAGLSGCQTPLPPGAEPGPDGTMAYNVLVDASPPGARIEANGADLGRTPVHLKIYGDPDGTFHDFGSYFYEVKAYPVTTNQYVQVRYFRTGHLLTPEDHIPSRIYFDMNQPQPPPPAYGYAPPPYYGPWPYYYGPGPYFYWGPEFRFYGGPRWHRRDWR